MCLSVQSCVLNSLNWPLKWSSTLQPTLCRLIHSWACLSLNESSWCSSFNIRTSGSSTFCLTWRGGKRIKTHTARGRLSFRCMFSFCHELMVRFGSNHTILTDKSNDFLYFCYITAHCFSAVSALEEGLVSPLLWNREKKNFSYFVSF